MSAAFKRCLLVVALCGVSPLAMAQVSYTNTTTDDSFLATGSPVNPVGTNLMADNFGAAGVLAIAPTEAPEGEFQTVLKFNLAGAVSLFDSTYGTNWWITSVTLQFSSNVGTQGAPPMNAIFNAVNTGEFVIEWMADTNWVEGSGRPMDPTTDGVTYDSLSSLLAEAHEPLCTNLYVPPGNNIHVPWPLPLYPDLVTSIAAGGQVAFRLYAADDQVSYIFNSHNFGNGNQPLIIVTAIPVLKIVSTCFTNGVFHLTALGGTNAIYQIQANDDLTTTNWQTIGTATTDNSGAMEFEDTTGGGSPWEFYRLSQ